MNDRENQSTPKHQQLVIAALGADQPGIVNQIASLATDSKCNILDSHMAVMGEEFAVLVQVSGDESELNHFQTKLIPFKESMALDIIVRKTQTQPKTHTGQPYKAQIIAIDHPGLVKEVSHFFREHAINIEHLQTSTYAAPHTGSPMFAMNFILNIAQGASINRLRGSFLDFCDERNLDASLTPYTTTT